jgi:hypothetical protein
MIRETFAICAAVKGQRGKSRERELIGERGRGPRVSEGRGGRGRLRTYGQIAVLLTVLADFLLGDGYRLRRFGWLLNCLWSVARAVRLRSDGRRKRVSHGEQ